MKPNLSPKSGPRFNDPVPFRFRISEFQNFKKKKIKKNPISDLFLSRRSPPSSTVYHFQPRFSAISQSSVCTLTFFSTKGNHRSVYTKNSFEMEALTTAAASLPMFSPDKFRDASSRRLLRFSAAAKSQCLCLICLILLTYFTCFIVAVGI